MGSRSSKKPAQTMHFEEQIHPNYHTFALFDPSKVIHRPLICAKKNKHCQKQQMSNVDMDQFQISLPKKKIAVDRIFFHVVATSKMNVAIMKPSFQGVSTHYHLFSWSPRVFKWVNNDETNPPFRCTGLQPHQQAHLLQIFSTKGQFIIAYLQFHLPTFKVHTSKRHCQGIVGCTPIPTYPYGKSLYKPYISPLTLVTFC